MVGMALILQFLAESDMTLDEAARRYPPFIITKAKVALAGAFSPGRISDALGAMNPVKIDLEDGVKAIFADGWIHLRVSNTEGMVRGDRRRPSLERVDALQKDARAVLDASW
jgi:phosphomannomutase